MSRPSTRASTFAQMASIWKTSIVPGGLSSEAYERAASASRTATLSASATSWPFSPSAGSPTTRADSSSPRPLFVGPRDRAAFVEPALEHARRRAPSPSKGARASANERSPSLAAKEREASGAVVIDGLAPPADVFAEARAASRTFLLLVAPNASRAPADRDRCSSLARMPGSIVIATFDIPLDRAAGDGLVAPGFAALFNGTQARGSLRCPHGAKTSPASCGPSPKSSASTPRVFGRVCIERIARAGWPGGITEIEEVLRDAAATSAGTLDAKSISRPLTRPPSAYPSPPAADDPALARERLVDALAKANGSIASAARTLGMSRQAVYREAQRLGLEVGKRRSPAKNH